MKSHLIIPAAVTLVFCLFSCVALAQPGNRGHYHARPPVVVAVHDDHHHNHDLDSVSRIFGAVALIVDSQRPVQPIVVHPAPAPVIIEKAPQVVIVEKHAQVRSRYIDSLEAKFIIDEMKIPNFDPFRAAILVSDPPKNSPLERLGLRKGDAISRVDEIRISGYDDLERAHGSTSLRYIKAGSNRVQSGRIFVTLAP